MELVVSVAVGFIAVSNVVQMFYARKIWAHEKRLTVLETEHNLLTKKGEHCKSS